MQQMVDKDSHWYSSQHLLEAEALHRVKALEDFGAKAAKLAIGS
jgi:hypothetical protein